MDLKLNESTNDLEFTGGELTLVDGLARIAQQARIRFRFFRGEWLYDEREGMPYYQRILGVKPIRRSVIISATRQAVLGIEGMRDVYDLRFEYEPTSRRASIYWTGIADDIDGPFTFADAFVIL